MKIVHLAAGAVSACVIAGCSVLVADDLVGLSALSAWIEKLQVTPEKDGCIPARAARRGAARTPLR